MNRLLHFLALFFFAKGQETSLEDSLLYQMQDPSNGRCVFMTEDGQGLTQCTSYDTTSFFHDPRKSDYIHIRGALDTRGDNLCLNRALCDKDEEAHVQAGICSDCGSKHWGLPDAETTGKVFEEGGTTCIYEDLNSDKCLGNDGFEWFIHDIGKPGPVSITKVQNKALTISWTPPEGEMWISGYQIQRSSGNGNNAEIIDTVGVAQNTYLDTNLENGREYTYRVRAYDDGRGYTLSDIEPDSSDMPSSAPGVPGIDTTCTPPDSCEVSLTPPNTDDGSTPSDTCTIIMRDLDGNELDTVTVPVEDVDDTLTKTIDPLPDVDTVCFSIRCENSQGSGQASSQSCEDITPPVEEVMMEEECDPEDTVCLMCHSNEDEEADFDLIFERTAFNNLDPLIDTTVQLNFRIEIQSTFTFPLSLEIVSASNDDLEFVFEQTGVLVSEPINFDDVSQPEISVDEPFEGSISITRPAGVVFDFTFLIRASSVCTRKVLQREIELQYTQDCPKAVFSRDGIEIDTLEPWRILTGDSTKLQVEVKNPAHPEVAWLQDGESPPNLQSMMLVMRRGATTFEEVGDEFIVSEDGDELGNDIISLQDDNGLSQFLWDLNELSDGDYTIRVHTSCKMNAAVNSVNWRGILDLNPPHLVMKNPPDGIYLRGGDVGFIFDDTIDCNFRSTMDFEGLPDQLASIDPLCGGEDGRIDFNMQNIIPFALGQTIHITARDVADVYTNTASEVFMHDIDVEDLDHDAATAVIEFDLIADEVPEDNVDEFLDDWKNTFAGVFVISPDRINVTMQMPLNEEEIDETVFPILVEILAPGTVDSDTLRSGDDSVQLAQDVVLTFYPDFDASEEFQDLKLGEQPSLRVDVQEGVLPDMEDGNQQPNEDGNGGGGGSSFPWWVIVLIVALVCVVVGVFYGRKKYLERQAANDDPLLYSSAPGDNPVAAVDMVERRSIG